jgi:hypothetical protein
VELFYKGYHGPSFTAILGINFQKRGCHELNTKTPFLIMQRWGFVVWKEVRMIGRLLIAVSFLFVLVGNTQSGAEDDQNTRLAAAKRYARVYNMPKMIHDSIGQIANSFPEETRPKIIYFMERNIDVDKLEKITLDIMVKHFTAEELNALADFYGSPVGQSILEKFTPFMADIQIPLMHEIFRLMQEWQKNQ